MKHITSLMVFLSIISCGPKKQTASKKQNTISTENKCPNDGTCTLQVFNNKGLIIKNTAENKTVYEMVDDINKKVILYKYLKNQEEATYDGGYSESVVFEIENNTSKKTYIDEELKEVKMFYNKQKNVRTHETRSITKGKLTISIKDGIINFNLELTPDDDNEKIKSINVIDGKL